MILGGGDVPIVGDDASSSIEGVDVSLESLSLASPLLALAIMALSLLALASEVVSMASGVVLPLMSCVSSSSFKKYQIFTNKQPMI